MLLHEGESIPHSHRSNILEITLALDRLTSFGDDYSRRIPPQNLEAEQAVLGSMLIERPAVEKAAEILKPEDFYRDAHRFIFEAMLSLAQRDEPVDLQTLSAELRNRNHFDNVGGFLYLSNLMEAPPTAANVEYYAREVEQKAILRRLMDVGSQIQALAHTEFDVIDEVVDKAESLVHEIGQKRMGQFFYHLRPLLDEELDRIEKRYENKNALGGRMTPFSDLNYMTAGLQPSDLIIVAARPSMGKCLKHDSLIDDPRTGERMTIEAAVQRKLPEVCGVSEAGEVRTASVGDWIDSGVKPCFRVRTRTGRIVEVTGHHPFLTVNGWQPLHDLHVGSKIAVPRELPVFGTDARLSFDEVRLLARSWTEKCAEDANVPQSFANYLEESKHFPNQVWSWTRELLAVFVQAVFRENVMVRDEDGGSHVEFATPSKRLAQDVHHALVRFGIVAELIQSGEQCWRVAITEPEALAAYQTQISLIDENPVFAPASEALPPSGKRDIHWDAITEIEPIGEHQVYDLTVPDGANFIAQDICVHNTALTVQIAQYIALNEKIPVAIFSLEMSKEQLVSRMIGSESMVNMHSLKTGYLQTDDWKRVGEGISRLAEAPIYIDDSPDISAMEIRAKCRRLQAERGLGLIVVDYLQLMRSHKKTENRNQEISEIARACKGLARELKVPLIALSQLSRAVESRPDKRPMLSDLRESGAIEAEADIVMFIYREAYYKSKEAVDSDEGEGQPRDREKIEEAELIIAKQRNGPTGRALVGFMPQYARFSDLADRTDGDPGE